MTRTADLEARRRALLARCEAQRAELAHRIAQLQQASPRSAVTGATSASLHHPLRSGLHPLAWVVALGGLALLGSTREVLTLLAWARTALSLARRAAQLVRLVGHLRTPRADSAR
jgi:hypothetical protein